MALPVSPGSTAIGTFNTLYTKREDISEVLFASMALENTISGLLPVGEPFADPDACRWEEDALNIYQYTDTTVGGQNATDAVSTLQLTSGQGASLMLGTVLVDEGQTISTAMPELMQVINVVGDTVTVNRGFASTTKVTHAANASYRNTGSYLAQTSDLDKDISRNRIPYYNSLARFGLDVQISDEQLQRAMAQYVPGVPNEFDYQVAQRVREIKRQINQSLIYSVRTASGDYSTFNGIMNPIIGGVQNQSGNAFTPDMVNTAYSDVFNQGGDPDWLIAGTTIVRRIANLYSDRIRIEQSERSRGWSVIYFDTDLGKTLRLILDAYMPTGVFGVYDSRRMRIRPFLNSFFYFRTAETMRDGEAARVIAKMSVEMRNTQTVAAGGAGFAHELWTNVA